MCRPDDFPPYEPAALDPYAEAREPVSEAALLRGHDAAILAAVDALGLPDCEAGCTCRGTAAGAALDRP